VDTLLGAVLAGRGSAASVPLQADNGTAATNAPAAHAAIRAPRMPRSSLVTDFGNIRGVGYPRPVVRPVSCAGRLRP